MVNVSLDEVFLEERSFFMDRNILREYDGVSPLNFILFSMRHPSEYPRAERYIELCDDNFRENLFKWLNFRHVYKLN